MIRRPTAIERATERIAVETQHAEEHRIAATQAGLNYVTEGVPGISCRGAGKGWAFNNSDGTRVSDRGERGRILALVIPPAWTDVILMSRRRHVGYTVVEDDGTTSTRIAVPTVSR